MTYFLLRDDNVLLKKELHWSPWANIGILWGPSQRATRRFKRNVDDGSCELQFISWMPGPCFAYSPQPIESPPYCIYNCSISLIKILSVTVAEWAVATVLGGTIYLRNFWGVAWA